MRRTAQMTAFLLVATLFAAACYQNDALANDLPFDVAQWRTGDARLRGRMAHDLHRKNLAAGKTKAEVKLLLGEPDSPPEAPNFFYRVDLGTRSLGRVMTSKLNVNFEEENQTAIGTYFTE